MSIWDLFLKKDDSQPDVLFVEPIRKKHNKRIKAMTMDVVNRLVHEYPKHPVSLRWSELLEQGVFDSQVFLDEADNLYDQGALSLRDVDDFSFVTGITF